MPMPLELLTSPLMRQAARMGHRPQAFAQLMGSRDYPNVKGLVLFSPVPGGTMVEVSVQGLPPYAPAREGKAPIGPFGFHLHDGDSCQPRDGAEPFSAAKGHYNPDNQPHGNHAGDFPVLFSNGGKAQMSFFTDRFRPGQIVDKTVMIHLHPDDYRTQPAGDSGTRIACGVVRRIG